MNTKKREDYFMSNSANQNEHLHANGFPLNLEPRKRRTKNMYIPLPYIVDFGNFLLERNYSHTTVKVHMDKMIAVQKFLEGELETVISSMNDFIGLQKEHLINYELLLIRRLSKNEIKEETAYCNLKQIRLFVQFLNFNKVINFIYNIPKKFVVQTNRLNTYIPNEILLKLLEGTALITSRFLRLRIMSILLIIIDTGCRPIEVSSLEVNDINLTERNIRLYSVKSGQRTLKLNEFVLKIVKLYIEERKALNPSSKKAFLNVNGTPITTGEISAMINELNRDVFGKVLVNARAIRHTYITDAIDNNNDFVEISSSVGHKHWESTLYYLYQNKKRLLSNTLEFNPIQKSLED